MIATPQADTETKLGRVYVIERADLGLCYVGQSITERRAYSHLKPGNYRYDALCADGVEPVVTQTEAVWARGDDLDNAERDEMRARTAAGWTLVNRLGPEAYFPTALIEFSGHGRGGFPKMDKEQVAEIHHASRTSYVEHYNSDPVFAAEVRARLLRGVHRKVPKGFARVDKEAHAAASRAGNASQKARRDTDPEYMAQFLAVVQKGAETRRLKRQNDVEWAARESESARKGGLAGGRTGGKKTSAIRRTCKDCDLKPTTPMGMWHHLKASQHSGYDTVETG